MLEPCLHKIYESASSLLRGYRTLEESRFTIVPLYEHKVEHAKTVGFITSWT